MKTDIHPTYYSDATMTCSCGAKYQAGSTTQELKIDVCSACHPFYTGKQDHLIDTTGRVDKFKAKMEKARAYQEKNEPKKVEVKEEAKKEEAQAEEVKEEVKKKPILEVESSEETTEEAAKIEESAEETTSEVSEEESTPEATEEA